MSGKISGKKPLLSIVTPVYNREDTIDRCIESVLGQDFIDYEFIVIDDGSTDGTSEVINRYLPNEKLNLLKLQENRGVNFARNKGIEAAIGEFITFLDSDDYLTPDALLEISNCIIACDLHSHLLFKVSTCKTLIQDGHEVSYEDWLQGRVSGDFLHVIKLEILKRFSFFEEVKAFEKLNWLRIFRESAPQLYFNMELVVVEPNRSDSLTRSHRLDSPESIRNTYKANTILLEHYFKDYERENINLNRFVMKTVVLGIALGAYKENVYLIQNFIKNKILAGILVILNSLKLKTITSKAIEAKRLIANKCVC